MPSDLLFVADIGATNARFAIADSARGLSHVVVLPTADLGDGRAFYTQVEQALGLGRFAGGCVAMAGPLRNGEVKITNGVLGLSQDSLCQSFGCPIMLVNDFFALAHGVPSCTDLVQFGGDSSAQGVKAVIGAGSGLGMSLILPSKLDSKTDDPFEVLPSEGGGADLACTNELELAVLQSLQQRFDHVSWETVLSGPGLVNLYQALSELWGYPVEEVTPEWISDQGVDAQVPLCHQTLDMFFGFLGSAAGNFALTGYAAGGVYIAGGIAPKLHAFARTSALRRRFEERGDLSDMARSIPMYLILDSYPGLSGALEVLRRHL